MSKESSTHRVIQILKDLQDGKTLSIKGEALRYETSERSIRRDFELIGDIFGDILINPQRGSFAMVQRTILENVLDSTEIYMLKDILKLSESSALSLSKNIDENSKKALLKFGEQSPYIFRHKPYEEIFAHKNKFKILEHAIKYRKQINFSYINMDKISHFTLCPYKIIFMSENFYLVSLNKRGNMVLSRIALIDDIKFIGKSFEIDHVFLEFCKDLSSPWAIYRSNYKDRLIDVVIQIPKMQAKYFKLKKFHPSQNIISEDIDGNVRIGFKVTNQNEIISVLKLWIPYVRVITPQSLVDIMKHISKKFYESMWFDEKVTGKNLP